MLRKITVRMLLAAGMILGLCLAPQAGFAQRLSCEEDCQEQREICENMCHEHAGAAVHICLPHCKDMEAECKEECRQ